MDGRDASVASEAFPLKTKPLPNSARSFHYVCKTNEREHFGRRMDPFDEVQYVKLLLIGRPFAEVSPKALQAM
jgi:hypothetical protein